MPQYNVSIAATANLKCTILVEANSEDEAYEIAESEAHQNGPEVDWNIYSLGTVEAVAVDAVKPSKTKKAKI